MIPLRFILAYWKYCGISLAAILFHFLFMWTASHYWNTIDNLSFDFTRPMLIMMIVSLIPAGIEGFPYEEPKRIS